ncbi:hypothetical protein B0H10DRAFT_2245124 [Mycena sp. CBHHK59/15]|nr:hypothetical protein B0H10DRAFT_2245124 [Mycena sp. CBHHK59/15]
MPAQHDFNDLSMLLPLFSSPRPAPLPTSMSSRSSPSPQGFIVPQIPPRDCPLSITIDDAGHRRLPLVSSNPLPPDHERVRKLIRHRLDITAKCANCAELAIDSEFFEAGVPCPPCAVLGIPDCQFADPYDFMMNLRNRRDAHFLHEPRSSVLLFATTNLPLPSSNASTNMLPHGSTPRHKALLADSCTGRLAFRGYQALAASSTDASLFSRFLAFGHDARIHPSVLRAVADRLQLSTILLTSVQNSSFSSPLCRRLGSQLLLPMPSFDAPRLSLSEEDAVRALHKTVRATRYDDPVDQDTFLVASAHSILQFQEQIASFASSPDLSECVFSIRTGLHQNNSRLESTTSGDVLIAVSDFAGEIIQEAAVARAERREALKYAEKKRALSPDEDTVSIPSDDEEPVSNNRPVSLTVEPSSPADGTNTTVVASPVRALLSPLPELESLMFSIRLTSPALAPPVSPSSPTQSLPDLVPISLPSSESLVNGRDWPQKMMHALDPIEDPPTSRILSTTMPPLSRDPSSRSQHLFNRTHVEAEVRRLAATQEHLGEQIQALQETCLGQAKSFDS